MKPFEWSVVEPIPHSGRIGGLVIVYLLGEMNIEAEEVDGFGNGVDLRLMNGLALIEHRRRIDRFTLRCRQ